MAEITFASTNLALDPETFPQAVAQALAATNPVDDLLDLARRLRDLELAHHLPSDVFYQRYRAGLLDEALQHRVEWAASYEMYIALKRMVESAFIRAAVQPELSEMAG